MYTRGTQHSAGVALIEVVVVSGILAVISFAFLGTFGLISRFHERNMLSIKGELLAEEGIEVLRLFKSGGWSELSAIPFDTPRYFELGVSSWSPTSTPEVIDGVFYRSFRTHSVMRDAADDIVETGGTIDPNTIKADVSVSWAWRNATSTVVYEAYLFNL